MTIQTIISEMITTDTSRAWDEYRLLFEKGLSSALVDGENRLDEIEDELERLRGEYKSLRNQVNVDNTEKLQEIVDKAKGLKAEAEGIAAYWDHRMEYQEDYTDVPSTGMALENYLRYYIDKMSLSELVVACDQIEQLKATNEIGWYYFVKCMRVVTHRLAVRIPDTNRKKYGYYELALRFKKLWHKLDIESNQCPVDNSIYGQMNLNIEDAIDIKREAEKLASRQNISVEEAYSMLRGDEDEMFDFDYIPEDLIEQENYLVEDILFNQEEL